ncbi:hypothetical protein BaRGS_00025676 [Batillaria attramentaria]|uniref:Uncharacterized protein n=1 Tax=Batillaria attramentaria TaxID=370345 RepID=A0ABD0K7F9_9CAEN
MDRTVDPCDDFFEFACGMWNKKNVIPEDKHSYNTFEKLHDELQITLKGLLEEGPGPHDSNATLKAKTLYRSCVNMTQITYLGDEPLREVTMKLGGWPIILPNWDNSSFSVEDVLADIRQQYNEAILIGVYVGADDKNSSSNIIQLDQPDLGMPSREYYLNAMSESVYVKAYLNFMRGVVSLLGPPELSVEEQLLDLLEFEKKLANVTRPQSERHDTGALYNKMPISRLQELVPQMNWLRYLRRAVSPTLTSDEKVVVFAVEYLQDMMHIVETANSRTLANYLIWRVVMLLAPELTDNYQEVHIRYRMVLQGVKRAKIRWKKCVEYTNDEMGLAVGAMFVRENFRKHSKDTALHMIRDIRDAFNDLLNENEWMDEKTKAVAKKKANAMNARIGYPDFITEPDQLDAKYDGLTFEEDYFFKNILAVRAYDARRVMSKLGKPVERNEWEQAPAVVNAFYSPNSNDIALVLQRAFSKIFKLRWNWRGRQYDIEGNLKQWWDNHTIQAFHERAQCIIDQYSGFKLEQTGLYIDGKNTQGENIAYRKWVQKHGEEPALPGINLSHDQLFFLNYAQIWCGKVRDEEALHGIRTSVHSPGPIRVLGPLSNSKDFARAYNCPGGSRMNPVHKCSVW